MTSSQSNSELASQSRKNTGQVQKDQSSHSCVVVVVVSAKTRLLLGATRNLRVEFICSADSLPNGTQSKALISGQHCPHSLLPFQTMFYMIRAVEDDAEPLSGRKIQSLSKMKTRKHTNGEPTDAAYTASPP